MLEFSSFGYGTRIHQYYLAVKFISTLFYHNIHITIIIANCLHLTLTLDYTIEFYIFNWVETKIKISKKSMMKSMDEV